MRLIRILAILSFLPCSPAFAQQQGTPTPPYFTIYSGQQTATTGAVVLPSQYLYGGIVLTALNTNTGIIYIGPAGVTASTGYPLIAGQSISYKVLNLNEIFMIGTNTTDKLAFTGN